jgi:hypothetical protein
MTGNFPSDQSREMDAEGIPDLEPPINQDEGMIPPRDYPQGATEFGVTAAEERAYESVADRTLREEPDFEESSVAQAADDAIGIGGRLLEPGSEDVDVLDEEKDSVATLVTEDEGALSAEEAAMHITDSP